MGNRSKESRLTRAAKDYQRLYGGRGQGPGPHLQHSAHRGGLSSAPIDTGGSASGPGPEHGHQVNPPASSKSRLRPSNRRGLLVAGAVGGAAVGGALYARHRRNNVHKIYDPVTGTTYEIAKRGLVAVPVPGSRPVRPLTPSGPHVSHENKLKEVRRRGRSKGSPSALAVYHSGSQTKMTGGGARYGGSASHVRKGLSANQAAARVGRRGTPYTDAAHTSRVGHRLPV